MATDARAYYDVDTQGFDPNTKQTRAFNQATAGVNPDTGQAWTTQERQALSDFFANEARKAQAQLPQNTAAPSGAKAPAQKGRVQQGEQAMAAVENWLRTPEAQNFLGGTPTMDPGQRGDVSMQGRASSAGMTGDPGQRGGTPRIPPAVQPPGMGMDPGQRNAPPMQMPPMAGMPGMPWAPPAGVDFPTSRDRMAEGLMAQRMADWNRGNEAPYREMERRRRAQEAARAAAIAAQRGLGPSQEMWWNRTGQRPIMPPAF